MSDKSDQYSHILRSMCQVITHMRGVYPPMMVLQAWRLHGEMLLRAGRNEEAAWAFTEACELYATDPDAFCNHEIGAVLALKAVAEDRMNLKSDAKDSLDSAVEAMEAHYGSKRQILGEFVGHMGDASSIRSDYETAAARYERALELYMQSHGERHKAVAAFHRKLSAVYGALGRIDEGRKHAQAYRRLKLGEKS